MPAGGTWIIQDKQRPGTYVNVKSGTPSVASFGDRGTVAIALPMSWGPSGELIELTGTDLQDGKSLPKVGCTIFDIAESLPYRVALSGCTKALLFRADAGGVEASVNISPSEIDVSAKYPGTFGNKLKVTIVTDAPAAGKSTVSVLVNDVVKESGIVNTASPEDLSTFDSEFVDFIVDELAEGPIPSGTFTLQSGANGTVADSIYTTFFNLLTVKQWQCLAIQSSESTVPALIKTAISSMRESLGRKVQGVVYNDTSANYEGIISVKQGFKTAVDNVSVDLFPLWVASHTAGASVDESKTAYVIPGAIEIINHIADDSIIAALKDGWFLLSYRQDGAVCVEQDINSLHTFTDERSYIFSKNRVVRCLDSISNLIAFRFNSNYAGKVDNNPIGRNLFKSEIIADMDYLQGLGAIQNFSSEDVDVLPGDTIESVVADVGIQPVDSMEKLYVTINLPN